MGHPLKHAERRTDGDILTIRILLRRRTGKWRKQVTDWHLNGGSYRFFPRNKSWFGEVTYMEPIPRVLGADHPK